MCVGGSGIEEVVVDRGGVVGGKSHVAGLFDGAFGGIVNAAGCGRVPEDAESFFSCDVGGGLLMFCRIRLGFL